MAPEPGQESEEDQVPLALAGGKPVGDHAEPPATVPTGSTAFSYSQDTRSPSMGVGSISTQLAPEAMDPCTLRLLWEQRELEIQALQWAVRHGQCAWNWHILQQVAGLPPERSSHSQDAFLQNQVQKLTLDLKAQKEQAQQERECLEAQLAQTTNKLQQLEAELQAFQKSCLLRLAHSSWVGRILRSQTGSVEVITAETLMESSDFSENDQELTAGELAKRRHKSLEWSTLPCTDISTSGGTDSDSSSCQLVLHSRVQKVLGHQPLAANRAPCEQIAVLAKRFSGDFEDLRKCGSHPFSQTSLEPNADICLPFSGQAPSRIGGSLQIVAVSRREKFVRILNRSSQDTADLGGLVLQQRVRHCPVRMFRFPRGTVLEPLHHLTVWGEGTGGVQQQPPLSSGQDPLQFHCGRGCVTLLLDAEGQVLSEHQDPMRVTSGSSVFADNTDWSIDRFPLPEAGPGARTRERQRRPRPPSQGRGQEARAGRRRPGTRRLMPPLSPCKPVHSREGPARPEGAKLAMPELLPATPEAARTLEHGVPGKERRICVCRRGVDLGCPMVALSVQSTAESRFGFRFLCCPPITADVRRRRL